ncbi:unnamed protein product [Candida verbasci]|uniref:Thioredoxin domain-containing protein n=1 Tax=Candida verbasci TaxID=1227364 RepID=A0A9W4TWH4_9ASCO|nr:unnamed protein product [Candida verbasci]
MLKLYLNFLFIISIAFAYTSSNIIQANDLNFQKLIDKKFAFVDFYADWCRHCKKVSPTVDQLSDIFRDYDIQFLKVNGDKDGRLLSKKYVTVGYPTLLLFKPDGSRIEFEGSRDVESLSNFIQQLTGYRLDKNTTEIEEIVENEKSVIHLTPDNFFEKIQEFEYSIISIGATWCSYCTEFKPTLKNLAEITYKRDSNIMIADYLIDEFDNEPIKNKFDIKKLPTLLFFKNGDPLIYKGDYSNYESIIDAINQFTKLDRDASGNLKETAGLDNKEYLDKLRNSNYN